MNKQNPLKKRFYAILLAMATTATIMSCSDNKGPDGPEKVVDPEFAIIVGTENGRYLLPVENLMVGKISPVGKGTNVSQIFTWEENVIQKGRDFYHIDPTASKFGKYRFENGTLKTIREIPFTQLPSLYIGWHVWLSETELMVGPRSSNFYAVIDVNNMAVTKSGEFDRTGIPEKHARRTFSVIPQGNKIVIGYGLYNEETKVHYDKSYTAVMDYPGFNNFKVTSEDDRSAPIGALRNGYFSQFKDKGYTYILTHTMPVLGGNKPNMPTGFFRIKDGEYKIDPGYFFNTSAQLAGDNQLGVTDLGNGKALLINAHDTKTNVKEFNDWWYASMWQYIVVDVNTQKVVHKLEFPLLGNSRSAVVHQGKAYIAVNDTKADGVYIWEYDSATNKLTKGAKIDGADEDTPVIYKLN